MVVKRFISWYSTRTNQSRTHLKMHAQRCSWERHANSWRCNECTLFIRSRASTRDWHTKNPTWAEPNFIGALFSYAPNPPTKTHPFLSPINERMTSHCIYWSAMGCHAFGARGRAPTGRCERHEWEESGEGPGGGDSAPFRVPNFNMTFLPRPNSGILCEPTKPAKGSIDRDQFGRVKPRWTPMVLEIAIKRILTFWIDWIESNFNYKSYFHCAQMPLYFCIWILFWVDLLCNYVGTLLN